MPNCSQKPLIQQFKNCLQFCSRTEIFFYTLLWLMVLLVSGTIVQKDIGLYAAQQRYFSSMILWIGFLPTPGGYATMIVLFINLFAKMCLSSWKANHIGTIVIHIAALVLLLGGFITAEFSYEGSMPIKEGDSSNYISDYYHYELVVLDSDDTNTVLMRFNEDSLYAGSILEADQLPFTMKIKQYHPNCHVVPYNPAQQPQRTNGVLRPVTLDPQPLRKEHEENRAGMMLSLMAKDGSIQGRYLLVDGMPSPQYVTVGNTRYHLELRKIQTHLPFSIKLIDFTKEIYPGTDKAKDYQSTVIVQDGDITWQSLIEMNKPLRYKGYTFYQASFIPGEKEDISVLAVVQNSGYMFPYISSIILCIGLLIHLFIRLPKLVKKA